MFAIDGALNVFLLPVIR